MEIIAQLIPAIRLDEAEKPDSHKEGQPGLKRRAISRASMGHAALDNHSTRNRPVFKQHKNGYTLRAEFLIFWARGCASGRK
jgi:hypothetical protein